MPLSPNPETGLNCLDPDFITTEGTENTEKDSFVNRMRIFARPWLIGLSKRSFGPQQRYNVLSNVSGCFIKFLFPCLFRAVRGYLFLKARRSLILAAFSDSTNARIWEAETSRILKNIS